jgi:CRP-like cAMP-binding protein
VVFPSTGVVSMTLPLKQGTVSEVALIGREGIVGAFAAAASAPSPSNAEVRIAGAASRISAKAFRDATAESVGLRRHVARCNSGLMAQVQQSASCNAAHVVDARLCRWLLEMQDRAGDKLPLTQESFAQLLGVRRTTVTLAASKLQECGAIECRRGYVRIANRALLERYACGCYRHVQRYTNLLAANNRDATPLRKAPAADSLSFRCPATHRLISTVIATDSQTLARTWRDTIVIACPHCGEQHTAKVSDAFIAYVLSEERLRGETGLDSELDSLVERMTTLDGPAAANTNGGTHRHKS